MADHPRIDGAIDQAKGAIKQGAGKLTGNKTTEAEGLIQKKVGEAESTLGRAEAQAKK